MTSRVIKEWLSEYKVLSKEEIHSYAASIRHNGELVSGLNALFEEHPDAEVLDPVCHQLFEFYRSEEKELQRFALELVPPLIWLYLSSVSRGEKSRCGGVEAFLLSVYNLETCDKDGCPKVKSFRIPSFSEHSIYHEPEALSVAPLLEATLLRLNAAPETYCDGPHPQYEAINGQNRHSVLTRLLQCYNEDISNLSPRSQKVFCNSCSRIVTTGFSRLEQSDDIEDEDIVKRADLASHHSVMGASQCGELHTRISVSPSLLIDMLSCLYYIMFNGQAGPGAQAIVDIHYRAAYELYADVLLVTNAIRNSLRENPSGQPDDGPIGLSLAMSPASSSYTLSKTAITNASFRAKKLPEDIPVQHDDSTSKLPTIEEDDATAKSIFRKLKKDKSEKSKTKDKDTNKLSSSDSRSMTNGDSTADSIQVVVSRSQQRSVVDSVEMTAFNKKTAGHLSKEAESNSIPYSGKHNSPNVKANSAMKTSISNKDIKNAKLTSSTSHTRNLSGGSGGSESYSTDL